MNFDQARALALLRTATGDPTADFRDGQQDAIRSVMEGARRLLLVQRTGWGKSFVYFIASRLLREAGEGPVLLVSPLLALMRNQIAAAARMGVRAVSITSDNTDDWDAIEDEVLADGVDILLISPERLANARFQAEVLSRIAARVSMLVIDEAHCISDWGHDFRPHYRLIERVARNLPPNLRLLATTATANNRVLDDLGEVLGGDLAVQKGPLSRPSLTLQTLRLPSVADRLGWLADQVPQLPGHGIIYTLTVRDAQRVAGWLASRGITAAAYSGESGEARPRLEADLLENRLKVLVATTALGMGFDKPDLGFVIHYQTPGSVVAYYQQVGRAGRALDQAYGVLLSGEEETDITDWFIRSAFPTREEVRLVLDALEEAPDGLSVPNLLATLNISKGRIDKALLLLSLEVPAPVVKEGPRWQLTAAELGEAFWDRAERLTALRRDEQAQMQRYVDLEHGHMQFLIEALDGAMDDTSGQPLPPLPTTVPEALRREATEFLGRVDIEVAPRKRWPAGGLPHLGVNGNIHRDLQAQPGRALAFWRDPGFGELAAEGKTVHQHLDDELVGACVTLLAKWAPEPTPAWVAAVPSDRRPHMMADFAERLANRLGLPFHDVLQRAGQRPEQKVMENSAQQARNVDGAVRVAAPTVPDGPVLLVDDVVDSGWTFTVCAYLLRNAGSGAVLPMALTALGRG